MNLKPLTPDEANTVSGGSTATPEMEADKAAMDASINQMAADNAVRNAVADNTGAHVDSGGRE